MADRPPFILAFAGDSQGCGLHRVMLPLASLVEAGVADGRMDLGVWPVEFGVACKPDVVVWQRRVEEDDIEKMRQWRQALPKALFIYEVDDYLDEVPVESVHASFMPTAMAERIACGLVHCDRITTTTDKMAQWLRTLTTPEKPIEVVPNALPVGRLKERKARTTGKLRVGFAGGISHDGDIELLRPAMQAIGDDVTWVFFGMKMEDPPVDIEYHDGVPITLYLDKMTSLDLDVMLAPLQANAFNQCKSNLRLLEAAAVGAAVIAQDMEPYRALEPPVFAYAQTRSDWTDAIQRFIDSSKADRQRSVDYLRGWAGRHYTLERMLPKRMQAWLPQGDKPWIPTVLPPLRQSKVIVACHDSADVVKRMPFIGNLPKVTGGLKAACRAAMTAEADILWLRPATTLFEYGYSRLKKLLDSGDKIASVVPLASDGPNGFPQVDRPTPMPEAATAVIAGLVAQQFGDRTVLINAPSGPAVLLSVRAMASVGLPDVDGHDGVEETAIAEWGLRASTRGWKHGQVFGAFAGSELMPTQSLQQAALRIQARGLGEYLNAMPEESYLSRADRGLLERRMFHMQWGGPRPGSMGFANDYPTWSMLRETQDVKIPLVNTTRFHIRTLNESSLFDKANYPDGSWIIFTEDDTELSAGATYWFDQALKDHPSSLVIYGDNNSKVGRTLSPEFKPDFDLTLFLAQDYVTPICAVRADVLTDLPTSRVELFEIVLKVFLHHGVKAFHHIPRILGSVEVNSKPEQIALETLERELVIRKLLGDAVNVTASRQIIGCLTVTRNWKAVVDTAPLVDIIIPTLGSGRLIQPCVATILQHTKYSNYHVYIVQNGKQRTEPDLLEATRSDSRVSIVHYDAGDEGFNWSKINNWAIRVHSTAPYIVTMNDDVCVVPKTDWLGAMMGHAVMPDVGVVGAKLVHPGGVVQHVGVVCHNGIAGHMHKGMPLNQAGHLGRALLSHEATAVSGACMLFSRVSFNAVGGFDATLSHNYNDTVFCLQQRRAAMRIVVEIAAELMHPEAASRPNSRLPEGLALLRRDNARLAKINTEPDPYWNLNMGIMITPDGLGIQGLNADSLAWTDFSPESHSQRILLINDKPGPEGSTIQILNRGDVPFFADLSGFSLRLLAPVPVNMTPWDIRDVDRLSRELKEIGIDCIVLRSLVGMEGAAPPVETLRTFASDQLDVSVILDAYDLTLMAPWLVDDGRVNEAKIFGPVDTAAWRNAYDDLAFGKGKAGGEQHYG